MILEKKLLAAAFVGASLAAFTLPAAAQSTAVTNPSELPSECKGSDGQLAITDLNAANCSQYDTTGSTIMPPNSAIHDESSSSQGSSDDESAGSNNNQSQP